MCQIGARFCVFKVKTGVNGGEEFHKNLVIDFLKKTYYDPRHFINTKGRNDLVIHNGNNASSSVGVGKPKLIDLYDLSGFFYFTGVVAKQVAREGFSGEI